MEKQRPMLKNFFNKIFYSFDCDTCKAYDECQEIKRIRNGKDGCMLLEEAWDVLLMYEDGDLIEPE